jgi:uncharacterized GH25 family protein
MKTKLVVRLSCGLLALSAAPLFAHDFWMRPSSFRPAQDVLLNIDLFVGDFGIGDALERSDERASKFIALTPDGEKKIVGRDGALPAGYLRTKSAGIYVLGYQSNHAAVRLTPEKFMAYLDERGLEAIKKLRLEREATLQPVREIYSRSSKCLLQVGERAADGWDQRLGLSLELTPLLNPQELSRATKDQPFAPLTLQLEFLGQALPGILVGALNLDEPPRNAQGQERVLHARTDELGQVSFELPRAGRWMIAAVHMLPLQDPSEAEYESFWGSLTFELL